ncbi:hypothetical protein [Parabacteroides sp.]
MAEELFSHDKNKSMAARIHFVLFQKCNYADGYVCIGKKQVLCRKGEYITTYKALAQLVGINDQSVRRYVKSLIDRSLVEVRRVATHVCFRICGYAYFTDLDKQPKQSSPEPSRKQKPEVGMTMSYGSKPRFDLLKEL